MALRDGIWQLTPPKGFLPGPSAPKYSTPGLQKDTIFGIPSEPSLSPTSKLNSQNEANLDGISALLKAREIVDRR